MSGKYSKRKLIIDCDPGTDDAQAILMALASNDVEIVAITTVSGNTSAANATKNVLRLLKITNRLDIPVYEGCKSSLLQEPANYSGFHGKDGFGDVTIPGVDPVNVAQLLQKEHATSALCRIVSAHPGSITLVALAPLTNLAVCQLIDPQFGRKLKECIVMGGNHTGAGNVSVCGEFNWQADPEAAFAVLRNFKQTITVVPFETCEKFSFSWEFYDQYSTLPTKLSQFVRIIDDHVVEMTRKQRWPKYNTWDQIAMAVAIDPKVILEHKDVYMTIELHGGVTRGQGVVDWRDMLEGTPNVRLVLRTDLDLCEEMMMNAVKSTASI